MSPYARSTVLIAMLMALAAAGASSAHEGHPRGGAGPLQSAEPTNPRPHASAMTGDTAVTVDPLVRALIIGLAANILREAAAQPDPVDALGNAVERRLAAALADPNTMRLVESGLTQAFQDAPEALREPLALFAVSVLRSVRREMLQERPRPGY